MLSGAKHLWLFVESRAPKVIRDSSLRSECQLTGVVDRKKFTCLALAAIGFLPHRLPFAFAGKEESRGAYRPGNIGR